LDHHEAVSIAEIGGGGACLVNLHGVVIGFSPPAITKRGDWMMGIALVDDTVPLPEPGLVEFVYTIHINIFTKTKDLLPKILFAGDVLRAATVEWRIATHGNDEKFVRGISCGRDSGKMDHAPIASAVAPPVGHFAGSRATAPARFVDMGSKATTVASVHETFAEFSDWRSAS
jgi:hypothetical protein